MTPGRGQVDFTCVGKPAFYSSPGSADAESGFGQGADNFFQFSAVLLKMIPCPQFSEVCGCTVRPTPVACAASPQFSIGGGGCVCELGRLGL